jgi:Zn finger protein HypA/HybF involved in hydrogenase expression
MPTEEKSITFEVKKGKVGTAPRWREVTAYNADCPKCGQLMVVISGKEIYAFCPHCRQYYVGE